MNQTEYNCIDKLLDSLRISDTPKTPGDLARETTNNDVTICTYLNSLYNNDIVNFSNDGDGYRRYIMTEVGKAFTNDEIKEIIKTKIKVKVEKYYCRRHNKNTRMYRTILLLKTIKEAKKSDFVSLEYINNNKKSDISYKYIFQIIYILKKTGYIKNFKRGYYKFTELFDNNDIEEIINNMLIYVNERKKMTEKKKTKNKDNDEKKTQPQDVQAEENTTDNKEFNLKSYITSVLNQDAIEEKSNLEKMYDIIKNNRDMEGIRLSDINKISLTCSYDGLITYEIEARVDGSFVVLSVTNGK